MIEIFYFINLKLFVFINFDFNKFSFESSYLKRKNSWKCKLIKLKKKIWKFHKLPNFQTEFLKNE